MKCETCKLKMRKPKFILNVAYVLGYDKYKFCKRKCFLDYIFKRYRKGFEKRYL